MAELYSKHTDQELLVLLKEGDRAAFAEIYDRYAPKIYNQVNRMLRDSEATKDVVQDLFIVIWNKSENINAKGNLGGYLYIAAQNNVLKFLRQGKQKIDYLNSLAELANSVSWEDELEFDVDKLHDLINLEIGKLPEKMKLIFQMSRRGDLSYKDIASQLGIAENTVRKQVSNALKIIRSNVDNHGSTAMVVLLLMCD